ncbi:MAG: aminotransferase class V-fold PLP-dependent enzyme [Gammaproteobacteria bacterium]|jgi:cystathionine gamma-synthase
MPSHTPHPETLAIHAGRDPDPATGAVAPPLHLSSTFARDSEGKLLGEHLYSRYANPTRDRLESCLAALEGGAACATFGSGLAAAHALFSGLGPGDHIIVTEDAYHGLLRQLHELMQPWGLQASFVDTTDIDAVTDALRPATRMLWVETPSNPMLRISDLAGLAEVARKAGILAVCDNTFATPILQNPLAFGFDLVMHSTTKYIGGHSDVLGGAVIAREESGFFETVRHRQICAGGVPSPFDCWLLLRSIASLPVRVERQSANGQQLAEWLAEQAAVERVYHPGLADHPGHGIAKRQMRAAPGVFSVTLRGGEKAAARAVSRLRLFTRATSLGGCESLIEHRAMVEGPQSRTPRNLLRVSTGLEHIDDLIEDFHQALA